MTQQNNSVFGQVSLQRIEQDTCSLYLYKITAIPLHEYYGTPKDTRAMPNNKYKIGITSEVELKEQNYAHTYPQRKGCSRPREQWRKRGSILLGNFCQVIEITPVP